MYEHLAYGIKKAQSIVEKESKSEKVNTIKTKIALAYVSAGLGIEILKEKSQKN